MTRNLLIALAILLAIGGVAKYVDSSGYNRGVASVKPKLDKLQAQVDAADLQARADAKRYKENFNELKKKNDTRVVRITSYYDRLLHAKAGADPAASGAGEPDGANNRSGITGCTLTFERACVLTANKLIGWQDYADRNNIPVQ